MTRMRSCLSSISAMMRKSPTRYFQYSPSLLPVRASPMLRGFSREARRPWRKARMRFAICGSSLSRARSAAGYSSTFHAITLHHLFKRDRLDAAGAASKRCLLRVVQIFHVFETFFDHLAEIESLGAACSGGQAVEPLFGFRGKTDGSRHGAPR